ncbi:unnamed protein product [Thelazia callipaeda]|uniref:Fructose-bisphosphate aldolase n=1 Tax=Thelazia callipaeda TaxID=103827 RepID=A0A0N5D765_THECL|nr:unnamed protein product [Thelazia callipaeda]
MSCNISRLLIDAVVVIIISTLLTWHQNDNFSTQEAFLTPALSRNQQDELHAIAKKLVHFGKGILAADESIDTIGKRFKLFGIENNEENRRNYRHLLFTTPNISQYISGIILHEETFHQKDNGGVRFVDIIKRANISPGIKLDKGLQSFDGSSEYITVGLNDLKERAVSFKSGGCEFAKWRCVFVISETTPSKKALETNAKILAKYAVISQKAGLVPIIEPEVLCDKEHHLEKVREVTEQVLAQVYKSLHDYGVFIEGTLLKPNMVIPGLDFTKVISVLIEFCEFEVGHEKVAAETLQALMRTVPPAVPGIVFLSGGQLETDATKNLNEINKLPRYKPWKISFSYGRALQTLVLKAWAMHDKEVQAKFLHRSKLNALAAKGQYTDEFEKV